MRREDHAGDATEAGPGVDLMPARKLHLFRQSSVQVPLAEVSSRLAKALGRDNETNQKLQAMLSQQSREIAKLGNLEKSSTIQVNWRKL